MEATEGGLGIFGDIWDKALGVFDKVADLELGKRELKLASDVQFFKQAQAAEDQRRSEQFQNTAGAQVFGSGFDPGLLVLGGVGLIAVFLIARG